MEKFVDSCLVLSVLRVITHACQLCYETRRDTNDEYPVTYSLEKGGGGAAFKMKLLFVVAIVVMILSTTTTTMSAKEDDYIHLPGKSCKDAPPCPDERQCVMAKPRCNVGTCPDLVPTCGPKS
uniref:Uncharacterized protein n=1 Tax=Vespula pensylvanica TaxID=30213 RepID=A0A834UAL6_VESPE|nr:hypothetical protein H0235_006720 [Vespula pensylvanica]